MLSAKLPVKNIKLITKQVTLEANGVVLIHARV